MTCRPNRATGTRSRLALLEETCWGSDGGDPTTTPVPAISGQDMMGMEFTSETLSLQANNIESQLIRSDRMRSASQQGNFRPGGDIVGELQPHGPWALLLKHVLGGSVTTTGSGPYTHSLEGSVDLPEGLSAEKRFGYPDGTFQYLRYFGGKVNEFGISVPSEGIVTARAGLIFKSEIEAGAQIEEPVYATDNEPFNAFQGAINLDLNGDGSRVAVATLQSIDITINNSVDGDQFAIDGTQFRADAPEDVRIVNGSFRAFFTDTNYALYTAYRNNTTLSLDLTLTRGSYSWAFTIPAFKVRGNPTPQTPGRGPLSLDIQFEAQRDDDTGTDIQVTIVNNDSVISTAE